MKTETTNGKIQWLMAGTATESLKCILVVGNKAQNTFLEELRPMEGRYWMQPSRHKDK